MPVNEYGVSFEELPEMDVEGPRDSRVKIKVGDKICFINPEVFKFRDGGTRQAEIHKNMLDRQGHGPFTVLSLRRYPAPNWMIRFVNDHGKEVEITRDYFTKYD